MVSKVPVIKCAQENALSQARVWLSRISIDLVCHILRTEPSRARCMSFNSLILLLFGEFSI